MSKSELLVALEDIIIDKVATAPTARHRKIDTSAPMEVAMAAQGDGESARERRISKNFRPCIAGLSTEEQAKERRVLERVRVRTKKGTKVAKMGGKNPCQKESSGKKRDHRAGARWQGRDQSMLDVWQDRTHCSVVSTRRQQQIARCR